MPPLGQLVAATLRPDGHVEVELADNMPDASQAWSHWQRKHAPENAVEYEAVERDAGQRTSPISAGCRLPLLARRGPAFTE